MSSFDFNQIREDSGSTLHRKFSVGFSIPELITVIIIISLITALVFANYKKGQKLYALEQATQKVASDIRRAQAKAIAGEEYPVTPPDEHCGYGITQDSSSPGDTYILYAGVKSNCSSGLGTRNYQPGPDGEVEIIELPKSEIIEFTGVGFNDIFFEPPDPKTYINNQALPPVAETIIKIHIIGKGTNCGEEGVRCITVKNTGLIKIE